MRRVRFLLLIAAVWIGGRSGNLSASMMPDSLPHCGWLCFLSEWNLKPYTLDSVNQTFSVGPAWGPMWSSGSTSVALLRHPDTPEQARLYGFWEEWIGYTAGTGGAPGPLTGTGYSLPGTYRYIAGNDDFAILHSININPLNHALYGYPLGAAPFLMRNDLDLSSPHIATDRHHRSYVAIREPGTNFSTSSILVLDTLGYGRWEFIFNPPLSVYNAMGMAVIGNGLYLAFGSLNPAYPNRLVRINLDCSTALAQPAESMPLPSASFTTLISGDPGDPLGDCPPNTDQPPMILTGLQYSEPGLVMTVSPNPVSSTLFVRADAGNEWAARLTHSSGAVVWTGKFRGDLALPVEHLPSGVYMLQINGRDTTATFPIYKY